jgi:amino acid adenylation domain-containing protein
MSPITTAPDRRALVDRLLRTRGIQPRVSREEWEAIPRRPRFSPCALSFAQQRLWLMTQLKPRSAAYNIPLGLRLRGALDLDAIAACLRALIDRHETLRTSFAVLEGEPQQIVHRNARVDLPLIDLTGLRTDARDAVARRLARVEARRIFDLSRAPLLRTTVLRLDRADHVVLLTMHHLVSDGWSISVLARELSMLYAARTLGQPIALPPLSVQYADFAVWQRARLQGDAFDRMLAHWKARLTDVPPIELPTDHPKPARRRGRSRYEAVPLSPALAARMGELSRRAGVRVFVTWVTLLAVWLHRYTGQRDLAIGVPIANRLRSELEGLIGFFVNQLVLRTDIAGHLTFTELLRRVGDITLDAFAHQDVPFDRVVEEIHPDRDAESNPLFQVAFAFHNTPAASLQVTGLETSLFAADSEGTRFDLELHVRETPTQVDAVLYFDTDLFERDTIVRRLGHLITLLDAACADPSRAISELPFLTSAERDQILSWNATDREWPSLSVVGLLRAQASRSPEAPAIIDAEGTWTYRELDERTNTLVCRLREQGMAPHATVGIWMERSRSAIAAIVATLKAGAAYVPLDPASPPARAALQLTNAGVGLVLTDRDSQTSVPRGAHAVQVIDADAEAEADTPADAGGPAVTPSVTPIHSEIHPESLAYVIYTSGSTGRPKGVMVTHRGLANYLRWARDAYQPAAAGRTSRTLFHSSLAFDLTVTSVLLPLVRGGAIQIVADREGVDGFTEAFRRSRDLDFVKLTPSHLRMLATALPAADLAARAPALVVGGEALDAALVDQWLAQAPALRVYNEYGPTETVVGCCVQELVAGEAHRDPVSIGRPIANMQAYVVTPHGQLAPAGVPGELWIGGVGVARGYLSQPDITAARFVPDPFGPVPGARVYRSGDAARNRADGTLEFLGRLDHEVKIRGYRIELGEIEHALLQHPSVGEAIVLPLRDPERGLSLAAYVVLQDNFVAGQERARLDSASADHVAHWQIVFDQAIASAADVIEPSSNFAGWTSSYDGLPIPVNEMREWVAHTVARIASLRPRRVLEIGCGTGLLLLRLAPTCERYVGTDISTQALNALGEQVRSGGPALARVALRQQPAHDFSGFDGETFDVIVLNSVVQYFPSLDYLTQVLQRAAACLSPGGAIFLGDVRCLPLLETFHASVQLRQALPTTRCDGVRELARSRAAAEEELVLAPAYFRALRLQIPSLTTAAMLLKRDTGDNELAKYRYDVILRAEPTPVGAAVAALSLDWGRDATSLDQLREILDGQQPDVLIVRAMPNARVATDVQALARMTAAERWETVGDLRQRVRLGQSFASAATPAPLATTPAASAAMPVASAATSAAMTVTLDAIWALEAACPEYVVDLSWAHCDTRGVVDAVCTRMRPDVDRFAGHRALDVLDAYAVTDPASGRYATRPIHRTIASEMAPVLSAHLTGLVPDYMIPASISILAAFPLAPSGKVDRQALPAPQLRREGQASRETQARTPAEDVLAGIWSDVLGIARIGRDENFFELGGHSLLATQVVSRVRDAFGVDLPLRAIFDAPTIAALTPHLRDVAPGSAPAAVPPLEPASRDGELPASFAQQRLYFLHQLDPQSSSYNVPLVVRIRGPLAIAALQRAIETTVARHEVLRTTFDLVANQPVQRIASASAQSARTSTTGSSLPMASLEAVPSVVRERLAGRLVRAEIARAFDLETGPLYRVTLLRLGADEHILAVVWHHVMSDAWSVRVLLGELGAGYAAYAAGREPVLPPLPVQYADFAVWQRRWLSDAILDRQIDYWRDQLRDLVGQGDLFRARHRRRGHRRGSRAVSVPAELSRAIVRSSRQHDVTVFMTALAALDIVLHAETGRTRFVVGTNVANRRDARLERLIGFFINQLALPADLRGDPSCAALLARVRATTLGAYDHQDLPFDRLIEALRPPRDGGRHPLFQVVFSFDNTPPTTVSAALPGLDVQPFPLDRRQTTADLTLTIGERPEGLSMLWEYDVDVFDDATVARLARKLVGVFEAVVEDPQLSVSAIVGRLAHMDRADRRTRRRAYGAALRRALPHPDAAR